MVECLQIFGNKARIPISAEQSVFYLLNIICSALQEECKERELDSIEWYALSASML